jgi:hypothetical protein
MLGPYVGRITAEQQMGMKLSDWGVLDIGLMEEWNEELFANLQKLVEDGIVERIGGYSEAGMKDKGLKELTDIQNETGVKSFFNCDDITLIGYFTESPSLFIDDCKIDKSAMQKSDGKEDIFLLLGNTYRNIPDGTVYQSDLLSERQYIVIGHMPKNYCFFVDSVEIDDELLNASLFKKLDDEVIFIRQDKIIESSGQLFYLSKGVTEETMTQIKQRADEEGIDLTLMNLETAYKRNNEEAIKESRYAFPYLLVITISVLIMLISYHLVRILGDSREYGIYYAVGGLDSDIFKKMLMENGLRLIISFPVATILSYGVFRCLYERIEMVAQSKQLLIGTAFAAGLVMAVVLLVIGTYIPWVMLKKKTPTELIRGVDDSL